MIVRYQSWYTFTAIHLFITVQARFPNGHMDDPIPMPLSKYDLDLSMSVSAGANIAIKECTYQFRFDKWNCPRQAFISPKANDFITGISPQNDLGLQFPTLEVAQLRSGKRSLGSNEVHPKVEAPMEVMGDLIMSPHLRKPANRETAFIHAITAAGITHTLIKNCTNGEFGDCGCDFTMRKRDTNWKWSGCSDNFHFGDQVAKKFLDSVETGSDSRSLANLHNNEAGRVAVRKTMKRLCKCHGVSGSCATQTCWNTLSDFRVVGNFLKKMYKQALRVDYSNGILNEIITENNSYAPKKQIQERDSWEYSPNSALPQARAESVRRKRSAKIKKRKLVFLRDSPNYCRGNAAQGIRGVIGRTCIAQPDGTPDQKKFLTNVRTCAKLCKTCGFKRVCDSFLEPKIPENTGGLLKGLLSPHCSVLLQSVT
eukprot:maker-scaffold175_size286436-snap-gene-0.10 protein:Tk09281 transcript:maker-scaffold175_size286436-snap-gene-0.10-mRNA-1 annotation:"protein wnt-8b isoform x1"